MKRRSVLKDEILAVLGRHGIPMAASKLYETLEIDERFTGQTANMKTSVNRLVADREIFRSKLLLGRGNTLLSLNSHSFKDGRLLRLLLAEEFFGRPALASLIQSAASIFALSLFDIAKIGCLRVGQPPDFDLKEAESLIEALTEIGVVKSPSSIRGVDYWVVDHDLLKAAGLNIEKVSEHKFAGNVKVRVEIAKSLNSWLANNSLVSPNGSRFISPEYPIVQSYGVPFDYLGFSYLSGLAIRKGKEAVKPRHVVGDILPDVVVQAGYANSFIRRMGEASAVSKDRVMPIGFILANGFKPEAFQILKSNGVLAWTTENLLGSKAHIAIQKMLEIFELLAARASVDPKIFAQALDGLENFQTIFGSLKGTLLEMLVAYLFSNREFQRVRLAVDVKRGEKLYDVDVLAESASKAAIIECKAMAKDKDVSPKEVRKHFTERTPAARAILLESRFSPSKFLSIVVTTGKFSDETKKDMQEIQSREDTTFEIWDRDRLISEIRSANLRELADALEKHFD